MKVTINGKEHEIYDTDDTSIIKRSIASKLKTIPKYLFFKKQYNADIDNEIIDILKHITTEDEPYTETIIDFLNERSKYDINPSNLNFLDDLFFIWLISNKELKEIRKIKDTGIRDLMLLDFYESTYKPKLDYISSKDVNFNNIKQKVYNKEFFNEFIESNYDRYKKLLQDEINENERVLKQYESIESEIKNVNAISQVRTTNFKLEEKLFDIIHKTSKTLIEIFNSIKLSKTVVYCVFNDFFKVYNEFLPPKDNNWLKSSDKSIMLKFNSKSSFSDINDYRNYKNIEILQADKGILIRTEFVEGKLNIEYNDIIYLIYETLQLEKPELSNIEIYDNKVKGYFYIPNNKFEFIDFIFSDMVMNEPSFYKISINEREKTTKEKSEIPIKFKHYSHGIVTCNINREIRLDRKDIYLKSESEKNFPINGRFLKFHVIKAKNELVIEYFRDYINRIFILYFNKLDSYIEQYNSFYPVGYPMGYPLSYTTGYIQSYLWKFVQGIANSLVNKKEEIVPLETIKQVFNAWKKDNLSGDFSFLNLLEYFKLYNIEIIKLDRIKDYNEKIYEYDKTKGKIRLNCNDQVKVVKYINLDDGIPEKYKNFEKDNINHSLMKFDLNENQSFIVSCNQHKDKGFIYPGLKKNPFPSNEEIPFLPCCFKDDQKIKYDKKTNKLIYRIQEKKISSNVTKNLIVTNKICDIKQFGVLPENIIKLFTMISPKTTFYRKGVARTKASFLDCMIESILKIKDYDIEKDRIKVINKYKNKLYETIESGDLLNYNIAKQECYDMTKEQILSYFNKSININLGEEKEELEYMNPNLLYRILEEEFECNIIIFTDGKDKKGKISIPRYRENHLKFKYDKNRPFVFIYENNGTQFPLLKYPQCEIIVRYSKSGRKEEYFPKFEGNEDFIDNIIEVLDRMNESYYLNKRVEMFDLPVVYKINELENKKNVYLKSVEKYGNIILAETTNRIIAQSIDSNGKSRVFRIRKSKKFIFDLITEPLPPINIESIELDRYKQIKYEQIENTLKDINGIIYGKVVKNDLCTEILLKINNIKCSIVTEPFKTDKLPTVIERNDESMIYISKTDSKDKIMNEVDLFNSNKKIARYLNEYVLYLFSKYINDKKLKEVSDNDIIDFSEKNISIYEDFDYMNELKEFSISFESNRNLFDENNKIKISSEELRNRLLFSVKLKYIRDREKLFNYYKKEHLDNYYMDVSDFDNIPTQIVLYKEQSIINYINDKKNINKSILVDKINSEKQTPYFFKNSILGNDIYLAQRVKNLNDAIYTIYKWYESKFNIGPELNLKDFEHKNDPENKLNSNIRVFSYTNSTDIKYIANANNMTEFYNSFIVMYKYEEMIEENIKSKKVKNPESKILIGYTCLLKL